MAEKIGGCHSGATTAPTRWLLAIGASMWLTVSACADREGDLPAAYRQIAVPEAELGSSEARARGRALYLEYCALCHGERADGRGVRKEGLTSRPRDFTSVAWRASTSPRHVYFAIREGLAGTSMPNWKALSEQDAWNMTAYVLSLAPPP
jgi:mono/diheme cytochrome c family protein